MADLFASESLPELGPPDDAERRALVALSLVPGVGPGRVRALLAALGSAEAVMRAPASRLVRAEGVGR
jgi:DNA processing protein